jgi:sigma-E factor negative regulatory protein RseB
MNRSHRTIPDTGVLVPCLLCILALSLVSLPALAQDALAWLERMQQAAVERNYRGTFVFTRGEMSSTQRIIHRFVGGLEQERLIQLDGARGEIVRKGSEVTCILTGQRTVQLEQSGISGLSANAFVRVMPEPQHYLLSLAGQQRVANRQCQVLRIEARDGLRYSYSLWLDQESGLLLKSLIHDLDGSVLEWLQYTSIEFPDRIEDAELVFEGDSEAREREVIPVPARDRYWPEHMRWKAQWLPPGFQLHRDRAQNDRNLLVFNDGMAAFSMFIEPVSQDRMPEGASRVGAITAYAQTLNHDAHSYVVTVVGEIPPMTAMQVAESVRPQWSE